MSILRMANRWSGIVVAIAAVVGTSVAVVELRSGAEQHREAVRALHRALAEHMQGQLSLEFTRQYDRLMDERAVVNRLDPSGSSPDAAATADGWWYRYWRLQEQQYQAARQGRIGEQDYADWLSRRDRDARKQSYSTCGVSFRDSWETYKARKRSERSGEDFLDVMDRALQGNVEAAMKAVSDFRRARS